MTLDLTDTNVFEEETPWYRSALFWVAIAVIAASLLAFLFNRLIESNRDQKTADFLALYAHVATPAEKLKLVREHLDVPDAAVELLTLGAAFSEAKDYASAQAAFALVSAHFPENPLVDAARLGEAGALEAQGKLDEALQPLQRILSSNEGPDGYRPAASLALARLREAKKDFSGARQALQEMIAKYPHSAFANEAQRELATLPAAS